MFSVTTVASRFIIFFHWFRHHRYLHSFPTRRSSDLFADEADHRSAGLWIRWVVSNNDHARRLNAALRDAQKGSHLSVARSEEHTSELQSRFDLVCRLLLEKKKKQIKQIRHVHTRQHH